MLEKLNWFCFINLITLVLLMWKWMGPFWRKNHLLRCWGWLSLPNWIGALILYLFLKLPPRKLEPWLVQWSFFLLRLLYIFINLPYRLAWNTVVMSGLVLLVATWICWISYKNGYDMFKSIEKQRYRYCRDTIKKNVQGRGGILE